MKIKYIWDEKFKRGEIGLCLNPKDKKVADKIETVLNDEPKLEIIDPSNNRKTRIAYSKVHMIEAMDHLSKVYTEDKVFYTKGRLKSFEDMSKYGIVRINNSTMLNISKIKSFKNGQYARLEVLTKDGNSYVVSRHYAKQIKEELL